MVLVLSPVGEYRLRRINMNAFLYMKFSSTKVHDDKVMNKIGGMGLEVPVSNQQSDIFDLQVLKYN